MNIDKNVVYGGDEVHNLCENFNSLGELLLKKLSEGKDKEKFVSKRPQKLHHGAPERTHSQF